MADLDLTGVTAARAEVGTRRDDLRRTRLALSEATARRDTARARGDLGAAAAAAQEAGDLEQRRASLLSGLRAATADVRAVADTLLTGLTPELAVTSLSGRHPVLLVPVRLETRFADGGATLRVRIFPDQIHVSAHDPAVTEAEVAGLTWYWTHRWPDPDASGPAGLALAEEAWQGLSGRLRPGRAAFLVRTYPPDNLGSADPAPHWPDLPRRSGEWSSPARAGLLPDRWCVLGFREDGEGRHTEIFRTWGAAVPDQLAAGPTPDPGPAEHPGDLPDDPDLRWLHDPAEAERLGMMVTVRQSDLAAGASLADGVDRLVALGVDWTLEPAAAAAAVTAHLAAQADEGRLSFVPQGSPTNSTGGTRSSFSTDPDLARQVLAPHVALPPAPGAAGPVAAAALGTAGQVLAQVAGAGLREQDWQQALLDATWSATGGYYLTAMLDPIAEEPAVEASLREHVVSHLRASGPLPTLRVGAQPYGLLPVVPRNRFEPDVRRRAQGDVQRVTAALRDLVEPLVPTVPRLGRIRRRDDVDDVVLALLQRTPVPWSLTFRTLVGPVERRAVSVYWDRLAAWQRDVTSVVLGRLGATGLPLLSELTHDDRDHPLDVPLVLKPDPTPEEPGRRSTGYLAEVRSLLAQPDGADILDARKNSVALLEAFVACAAVNENRAAAGRLVIGRAPSLLLSPQFTDYARRPGGRLPYTLRIEPAVLAPAAPGSGVAAPTTPREFGQTILPALTGDRTLSQFVAERFAQIVDLPGLLDVPDDPMHQLARMDAALGTLAQAPADQLEWAFRGVLDLYSTRLDAWITSLATARLAEHRAAEPAGLHVGGWGVVEGLRPDSGPEAESLGFVHAPSLAQAASVAVLRSARAAHRDAEGRLFDLDLTSRRVRQALRVLEGIGAGQRLAALLGYRIERGLQDRDLRLAQWILPLRMQCPLRSERPDDPDRPEPVEAVAARDVVDGVALLARWAAEGTGLLTAAGVAAGAHAAVGAVLDDVAGLADAVSDVLVAEATHQATSGNLERAGAALAAHDRQGPPPDPDFVRTPRAGAVLTHRVGLWLPRDATGPAPGWPADLRSLAEPRLDRWLGTVLGDPAGWTVSARLVRGPADAASPGNGAPQGDAGPPVDLGPRAVASLGLSALSLVLSTRRPGTGQPSELESRLAAAYAAEPGTQALQPGPNDRLELLSDGIAQLLDLAGWAAEVTGAAPLSADHLSSAADLSPAADPAGGGGPPGPVAEPDVAEATGRAEAVRAAVTAAADRLDGALAGVRAADGPGTRAALAAALLDLVEVEGLDVLLPVDGGPVDGTPMGDAAERVLTRVRARLQAAAELPVPVPPPPDPGDLPAPGVAEDPQLTHARGVLRLLLGNGQPLLPVLAPADPAPLAASLAARADLLAGDDSAAVTWLHRSALVRPQLDPLAALLVHAEAAGAPVDADLAVLQSPHVPGAPWVALPFGETGPPPAGAVGLVLHAPDGLDPAPGGAGVVVDSWTETVPASEETTAVTFHFDAPGARAPQTALLAVHPDRTPDRWDFDTLLGCVQEAVDLAHLRTVGSPELAPFATFLPALFLPDTYTRDVPGVRLWELATTAVRAGALGLVRDHVLGKGTSHA